MPMMGGGIFRISLLTLLHQPQIELHRPLGAVETDPLVVAVDGLALLGGEIHGREAVDVIRQIPVMTAVGAL